MNILIVDDSRAMRMIIKRTMRQAGYTDHKVLEASNGVEAIGIIDTNSVDLVLCDWNMPEMSGIELLHNLNAKGKQLRFGFITSEGSDERRKQANDAGAMFLLTKPFSPDKFQHIFEQAFS